MKTIDEMLTTAANAGELTYLSIVPRAGKGGVVFSVMYRGASEGISGMAEDADPAKAVALALGQTLTPTGRKKRAVGKAPELSAPYDPAKAIPADYNFG